MGEVYPGKVEVRQSSYGGWYARVTGPAGTKPRRPFIGAVRATEAEAVRDAAGWLEDRGYVHPLTHDC